MKLYTRGDLDGVACAAMITRMEEIEEVVLVHPKDVQDGEVDIEEGAILANLPYHPHAVMWYDNHDQAEEYPDPQPDLPGKRGIAPSAARLVYEYYDADSLAFHEPMLEQVDRLDSAQLTMEDLLTPSEWILLGFTLDPRTGLGGEIDYAQLLVESIKNGLTAAEILELPMVKGRVRRFYLEEAHFKKAIDEHAVQERNLIFTDFRDMEITPPGSRFLVFALFPEADIEMRLSTLESGKVLINVGKSIFKRDHPVHVGKLMAQYGGGGLAGAGSCRVDAHQAEVIINELKNHLIYDDDQ